MTIRRRFRGMRSVSFLLALLTIISSVAAEEPSPRKRGGFTGATPKPVAKKGVAATPAPKKQAKGADDPRIEEPKKSLPKRKAKPAEEDAPIAKQSSTPEAPAKTPPSAEPETSGEQPKRVHAPAATVAPEEIAEFAAQPPGVQSLITAALELTKLNLTYTFGSADPAQGGMDCSGTMYHLLRSQGLKEVPRDSSGQYVWARKAGRFFAVVSKSAESFEFKDLLPGDLLFWTGTYETGREIPISHVMLYLGTEKKTKKRIMFGASDGRSYAGVQRWGVSVFDFKMPRNDPASPEKAKVDFVGYGRIPQLRDASIAFTSVKPEAPEQTSLPAATPKPKRASAVTTASKKKR